MKANEFIDGIYVYFNCFDGSKITVKVTGFKDGVVYGVSEHSTHWCQISKTEPIPLTPDILEKNGFFIDTFQEGDEKFWVREDFVFDINGFTSVGRNNFKIEYVHQLQHALRLCGIEKEIVL